jgi:hypothetical protein
MPRPLAGLEKVAKEDNFVLNEIPQHAGKNTPFPREYEVIRVRNSTIFKFIPVELNEVLGGPNLPSSFISKKPIDYFLLLFDQEVINLIVECININAAHLCRLYTGDGILRLWRPISIYEIKRFLGIMIYMGVYHSPQVVDY